MITLFAEITAKNGKEQFVFKALQEMLLPSRDEPGCSEYRITQSNENPALFLTYEIFDSMEAVEVHVASDHYQNLLVKVGDSLLKEPKVTFATEIEPS